MLLRKHDSRNESALFLSIFLQIRDACRPCVIQVADLNVLLAVAYCYNTHRLDVSWSAFVLLVASILLVFRAALMTRGGWCMYASANFERLVLGCIKADFGN